MSHWAVKPTTCGSGERLFDETGKLLAEVEQEFGDSLVVARLCSSRPYKELGEYRTLTHAKEAVEKAIANKPLTVTEARASLDVSAPAESDGFFYGGGGTIHHSGEVNVETDPKTGAVVAVWFRCMMLPFTQTLVDPERAKSMGDAYEVSSKRNGAMYPKGVSPIVGITFAEKP